MKFIKITHFILAALALCYIVAPALAEPLPYTGVNIAGGEFYVPKRSVKPVYDKNFTYPTPDETSYFASKGMNIIRLPFRWETIQPIENAPLDETELARLKRVVDDATHKGLTVLLDPHNSARYYDEVIGGGELGPDVLAGFWERMARCFKSNSRVWFGLTNEPHDMPNDTWLTDANAAIAAIRKTGARNTILVCGNSYSTAETWTRNGNDSTMLGVRDPKNHWMFEPHCYLDRDNSGTHDEIVSPTVGVERLGAFTQWCRTHHFRAFLGEVAAPANPAGHEAIDKMLTYMEANRDVWVGFTWWAAGHWWGNYLFSIEPKDGVDKPQLAYLAGHLQGK